MPELLASQASQERWQIFLQLKKVQMQCRKTALPTSATKVKTTIFDNTRQSSRKKERLAIFCNSIVASIAADGDWWCIDTVWTIKQQNKHKCSHQACASQKILTKKYELQKGQKNKATTMLIVSIPAKLIVRKKLVTSSCTPIPSSREIAHLTSSWSHILEC